MAKYRNVDTGRELDRPGRDEWLEASSGWERVDNDKPSTEKPSGKKEDEGSKDE